MDGRGAVLYGGFLPAAIRIGCDFDGSSASAAAVVVVVVVVVDVVVAVFFCSFFLSEDFAAASMDSLLFVSFFNFSIRRV